MNIPVVSRVHRCLSQMEKYHSFEGSEKKLKDYPVEWEEGEDPIGVYENTPNQIEQSIVITDRAIYFCNANNHSEKANYRDIVCTETPKDKLTHDTLVVKMNNGRDFLLPIKRDYEGSRTSNLFEFIRFLNRVKDDLQSHTKFVNKD